jgi:cytochrome c biogenesis protein
LANNFDKNDGTLSAPNEQQQANLTKALWSFFSEMKTAIVLLFILALISILGTVIRQNASPEEYTAVYGASKYAIIKLLSLTNVYDAWHYRLVLALVGINLTVCSLNRFNVTWRRTFQPNVRAGADRIEKMQRSETIACSGTITDVTDKISAAMHSGHYQVIKDNGPDDVVLFAAKGRISLWGPYLTHLSLLVIFIGAIFGKSLGFTGYTAIHEGGFTSTYATESTNTEKNLGFKVGLDKFEIGHDNKGNPTAYKSDLQVYEGDVKVAEKVIDVNHPLTYKGVSFFQSDYGMTSIRVKITGSGGQTEDIDFEVETGSGPFGKTFTVSGESFKQVSIGGKLLTVFVHDLVPDYVSGSETGQSDLPINPAAKIMVNDRLPEYKELDAWSKLGWLEVGKSAQFKDFTVTFDKVVNYTGLQVSRNPGLPVIYLGFGLLLTGIFLSFYVPYRMIRIRISTTGTRLAVIAGASTRDDTSVFDSDFKKIRDAIA